ncbi:MAG: hypothetical protein IPO69_00225 [Saprospiraceae bacterium]|nr:hypothetical protein [Saprospiraceae bacterium]
MVEPLALIEALGGEMPETLVVCKFIAPAVVRARPLNEEPTFKVIAPPARTVLESWN